MLHCVTSPIGIGTHGCPFYNIFSFWPFMSPKVTLCAIYVYSRKRAKMLIIWTVLSRISTVSILQFSFSKLLSPSIVCVYPFLFSFVPPICRPSWHVTRVPGSWRAGMIDDSDPGVTGKYGDTLCTVPCFSWSWMVKKFTRLGKRFYLLFGKEAVCKNYQEAVPLSILYSRS